MERQARVANAIVASIASRPSQKPLILCTIVASVSEETVGIVLQSHSEGSSLPGVSRISGLAYNTGVSIIRAASQKAQMIHNAQVKAVETEAICADELWSFVEKNRNTVCPMNSRLEIAGLP